MSDGWVTDVLNAQKTAGVLAFLSHAEMK